MAAERPKSVRSAARSSAPLGHLDDAKLVESFRRGESAAFAELVRRYQDRVFNTCWRICGHLEDARDLCQETFLKTLQNFGSFREESGFYTWVFRVAVNLSLSHRRSAARHRTVSLGGGVEEGQAENLLTLTRDRIQRSADSPGEEETQTYVLRALQTLDDDQRAVVVLRDIEGFDYQEIGAILEISTGTVKSRLHRARMNLRESMRPVLQRRGVQGG